MKPVAQDGETGCGQLSTFDTPLLECQCRLDQISELVFMLATIPDAFAI